MLSNEEHLWVDAELEEKNDREQACVMATTGNGGTKLILERECGACG